MPNALMSPALNTELSTWFDAVNRRRLKQLIRTYNVKSVLEIGSFLGQSAIWFAQQCVSVTCVDTWKEEAAEPNGNNLVQTLHDFDLPHDFFHVFQENIAKAGVASRIKTVRENSRDAHLSLGDEKFDLVYIDGDHSYEGLSSDIRNYGPKALRVLCGDDYARREEFGVMRAVDELLPRAQKEPPFWWMTK